MKLKLRLDDLHVETFGTTSAQKQKGMVFGEQCTCWTQCGQNTCPGCPTCDASCNGTCGASCNGTCGGSCDWTCQASCNDTCYDSCAASCVSCQFSCDDMQSCVGGVYGMC